MNINIKKASLDYLDRLDTLYQDACDLLEGGENFPGWKKGVYPNRETAAAGIGTNQIYVALVDDEVAGSMILRHDPEDAYVHGEWSTESNYDNIYVIYTFVVNPKFKGSGIGKAMLNFAIETAKSKGMTAIRLDVTEPNIPARKLYENCGFKALNKVDLGLSDIGLPWFRLYEYVI